MKTLNETFTDEEYNFLKKKKKELKKSNWHKFILFLSGYYYGLNKL